MESWGIHKVKENCTLQVKLGDLDICVENKTKWWRLSTQINADFCEGLTVLKHDDHSFARESWENFVVTTGDLLVLPAMMDRAIVVKPNEKICLFPQARGRFYVHVPVHLCLYAGSKDKDKLLIDRATKVLTSTWIGEQDSGELGYLLRGDLLFDASLDLVKSYMAVCPIVIENASKEKLNIEKLVIRAAHLNLYRSTRALVSDEIVIKFQGAEQISDTYIQKHPPEGFGKLMLLQDARDPYSQTLLKRSFYFIKNITQY